MQINEISARFIVRNDTSENWNAVAETAVLLRGEIGVEFADGTTKVKVGDGVTPWNVLPYVTASDAASVAALTWGHIAGAETGESEDSSTTEGLGLVKPSYTDVADIAILNANADIIDEKTMEIKGGLDDVAARLTTLIQSTTADDALELLDIRTAHDGTVYDTAGDAVRALGKDMDSLKENLSDFLGGELVDGLKYENSQLWLMSGDTTVGEPVTITGGSGTGGGTGMYNVSFVNL